MRNRPFAVAVALVALVWAGAVPAYEGVTVTGGGSIRGTVKLQGTAPAPKEIETTKDREVCGAHKLIDESLIVASGGGIKNAVVSITNITRGKALDTTGKPELDQHGCTYVPHVLTVPAGSELQIRNSDGILHNIHTYSTRNPPMNRAQPKFKKVITETFSQPETIRTTCDAHGWMQGWLIVIEHPYYAVTDDNGGFQLTDVPAGDYELKVWHEKLGEQTQKVVVAGAGQVSADFLLTPK